MNLSDQAFSTLSQYYARVEKKSSRPTIWEIDSFKCNVRTASKKSGDKYWFDVTPAFYEEKKVDYFIYVCGSSESIYIFPCEEFSELIKGAHLGGQKQVPNFTIFDDVPEFEPAGSSYNRHNIAKYKNGFKLISKPIDNRIPFNIAYPEEVPEDTTEGAKRNIFINVFERSAKARKKCIEYYGYKCVVCDFDFSTFYGEKGYGYIHVHHIVPISKVGKSYVVEPINDLRPICPNCHAMIHRTDPPISIEELKAIIKNI